MVDGVGRRAGAHRRNAVLNKPGAARAGAVGYGEIESLMASGWERRGLSYLCSITFTRMRLGASRVRMQGADILVGSTQTLTGPPFWGR